MNQPAKPSAASPNARINQAPGSRSEALLPADENDPNLEIAEEVAFDLQSDQSRKVGSLPDGEARIADAVADTLKPEGKPGDGDSSRPH